MNDTKKCPYCGGEILSVAKKCKHCGKWLNENIQTTTTPLNNSSKKEEVEHLESPIKPYASWSSFLGILISLIPLIYAIGIENMIPGKWGRMLQDPEWLVICGWIYPIAEVILLYGLLTGLKGHSKPMRKSLSIYIISYIASIIIALVTEDETISEVMDFLVCVVMQSIIGIRLLIHYQGGLTLLGVCMVGFAGLSLIECALESESVILEIISFIINFFYFASLGVLFTDNEKEKET